MKPFLYYALCLSRDPKHSKNTKSQRIRLNTWNLSSLVYKLLVGKGKKINRKIQTWICPWMKVWLLNSASTRLSRNGLCDQVFYRSYVLRHIRLRSYCSLNVKTFWETCAPREVRRVKLGRPVEERGWGLTQGEWRTWLTRVGSDCVTTDMTVNIPYAIVTLKSPWSAKLKLHFSIVYWRQKQTNNKLLSGHKSEMLFYIIQLTLFIYVLIIPLNTLQNVISNC